jgi:CheY-like chemotaxis protein
MPELNACTQELAGLHVLLVEGDDDCRELFRFVLGLAGATVTSASGAAEALEVLERETPDVVVSDTALPGQDGWALVRAIRRLPLEPGARVPAVAVSGLGSARERVRSLSSGFDVHLSKPVRMDELVAAVARLAGERRGSAEPTEAPG